MHLPGRLHPERRRDRPGGPGHPIVLRLIQGISAGGEQAGSALLALEHAPDDRRGFYTSWTQVGSQLGNFLVFVVFVPLAAVLPESAMADWGWRIPFWLSAVVVLVTYVLRRRLAEPVVRRQLEREGLAPKVPLAAVLRDLHRAAVVRIMLASVCIAPAGLVYIFGLAYHEGNRSQQVRPAQPGPAASLIMVVTQPLFGLLSDRIGRKPVFVIGVAGSAAAVRPAATPSTTGTGWGSTCTAWCSWASSWPITSGVLLATFLEMFPADIRFSGMGVSFTAGIVITGFIPAIAQSMVQGDPGDWAPIAWLFVGLMTVSGLAVASGRETSDVPTAELGLPRRRTPSALDGEPPARESRLADPRPASVREGDR